MKCHTVIRKQNACITELRTDTCSHEGEIPSKYSQITFVMYHKVEKQVLKLSETAAMSKVSPRTLI